jgi:hypothetical protein
MTFLSTLTALVSLLLVVAVIHHAGTDSAIGIEKVGDILVDLTSVNKSKMPKRREGILKRTVVNFEFGVIVEFGNRTGVLEVKSLVNGSVLGTTTLSFD